MSKSKSKAFSPLPVTSHMKSLAYPMGTSPTGNVSHLSISQRDEQNVVVPVEQLAARTPQSLSWQSPPCTVPWQHFCPLLAPVSAQYCVVFHLALPRFIHIPSSPPEKCSGKQPLSHFSNGKQDWEEKQAQNTGWTPWFSAKMGLEPASLFLRAKTGESHLSE